MIGLVDWDLYKNSSTNLYVPNIEIMKLSAYYRLEKQEFCRLVSPQETNLQPYDKIYFFSEQDSAHVPEAFKKNKNVVYGGTAFTNGKYVPFKDEIIDYTLPRTYIYKDFLREKYNEGIKYKQIDSFLDNGYYRAYAGKNRLPIPAVQKRKRIYLYDREFFYPDWKDILKKLTDKSPTSIFRIHPVICDNLDDYFEIRKFAKFSKENEIILDMKPPYSEMQSLVSEYEKRLLADINMSSNVYITFGKGLTYKSQFYNDIIYSLNFLYSFWSKGILIKLKASPIALGMHNPVSELYNLIENWGNASSAQKRSKTLESKLKKGTIEYEQYKDFLMYHPSSKDLFGQSFNDLKNRRYWRI